RKTKTGAFADLFRGEKRLENPSAIRFFDPAAGITNADAYPVVRWVVACRHIEVATRGHTVCSIVCEIQNDLRDFIFVHMGTGNIRGKIEMQTDALHFKVMFNERENLANDVVDVGVRLFYGGSA